jgi:hypothetical protein
LASYPGAPFYSTDDALQRSAALCWINSCTFSPLGRVVNDVLQLESTHFQLLLSSCCHIQSHSTPTPAATDTPTPRHPRISALNSGSSTQILGKAPFESGQTCLIATQLVNPNLNTARLNSERPSSSSLERDYGVLHRVTVPKSAQHRSSRQPPRSVGEWASGRTGASGASANRQPSHFGPTLVCLSLCFDCKCGFTAVPSGLRCYCTYGVVGCSEYSTCSSHAMPSFARFVALPEAAPRWRMNPVLALFYNYADRKFAENAPIKYRV